jgi:hypothetical protein
MFRILLPIKSVWPVAIFRYLVKIILSYCAQYDVWRNFRKLFIPPATGTFKGTVAWGFCGFFGLEWVYVGLNRNRFWFFSFTKEVPTILDSQFKYWCVYYQTLSYCRFVESPRRIENWVRGSLIFLFPGLAVLWETLQRLSILLGDW